MATKLENIPQWIELKHAFFKPFDNPHFRMAGVDDETAVFVGELGEQEVVLSLKGIKRELKFADDSPEAHMLDVIGEALNYVVMVRPGDAVPSELLSGDASWEPTDKDIEAARRRVNIQLLTWISGEEQTDGSNRKILDMLENEETEERINDAFEEAAKQLGLSRREEVTDSVEKLAKELAYIEALRSMFATIVKLERKLQAFRVQFKNQNSTVTEIDQILRLMRVPIKAWKGEFEMADAQTGEIIMVLKNIDMQISFIRETRDDLHRRFMAWSGILKTWEKVEPGTEPYGFSEMLRELNRFLAPRYMSIQEWVLNDGQSSEKKQISTAMTW